jgi:hypothetical protein
MNRGLRRPLGFLLLMLGFGLRLDSLAPGLDWLLLAVGGALGVAGLAAPAREPEPHEAFVPRDGRG